jgi:hypothetical protein
MQDHRWLSPGRADQSQFTAVAVGRPSALERLGDAVWVALHAIGAHRWRDGYDVDQERGMRQYRGSRCTICDSPWEGW